jgi:ribonucleoside-diphosphate reductase alpha chain
LRAYVDKFSHTRFEPMGYTKNPDIRIAKSIIDYIFRWLGLTFLGEGNEVIQQPGANGGGVKAAPSSAKPAAPAAGKPAGQAHATTARSKNGAADDRLPQQTAAAPRATGNGTSQRATTSGLDPQVAQSNGNGMREFSEEFARLQSDAPACDHCGSITVRNGNCYLCYNCGNSMGCS